MTARQKGVLAAAFVTTMISSFMGSALNLSISDISSEFASGATTVTWVINIFTLIVAALSVPIGHLGDIADRRRIFLTGIALFAVTSLGCAIAPSIEWLIAIRALQSVAGAMIMAVNIPVLINAFPPTQRGRVLGYSVTAVYLGLSIGPVVGGWLNDIAGWRSIFLVSFLLPALSFFLAWRYVDKEEVPDRIELDGFGNVLYLVMIIALLAGLSLWNDGWWAQILVLIGIVLLPGFVLWERRAAHPAVDVRLFRNPAYSLSNIAALLNYGATFAIGYTMSLFLQNVLGLSTSLAGLVLISQPVMQTIVSPFAGRLSDRIAPYKLASAGMAIIAVGLFLFAAITPQTPVVLIIVNLAIVGFGFGLFSSPNTNAVLSCVDRSHVGEANAILGTMRSLGMSISMVIVIFILGSSVGNVVIAQAPPSELSAAVATAMQMFAWICVVGTAISLVRGKPGKAVSGGEGGKRTDSREANR